MGRVDVVAVTGALWLLATIVELVRRRRLREEYALLWILTSVVLLVLSVWRDSLLLVSRAIGIFYPPSALFLIGFGFVLLILLHFSTVISRLAEQNKELAQRYAILDWEVQELRATVARAGGETSDGAITATGEDERLLHAVDTAAAGHDPLADP